MDFGDFNFLFTPFLFRSRRVICSRQGSGPWERTNISRLLKLSWQTLRAYQAFAPRSISFFTRIACGAHGLVSTNEFMCFYVRFHGIFISISFIVDKITILYLVFVSSIAISSIYWVWQIPLFSERLESPKYCTQRRVSAASTRH